MTTQAEAPERASGPMPKRYVGVVPTAVLLVIFASAALLLLGALIAFWPEPVIDAGEAAETDSTARYLSLDREQSLLVLVAIGGALGAMGHVLRSFYRYVGERKLVWSWVASYLTIPVVGAVIATVVYIVLRAGLLPGASPTANEFGFVAIAALSGMFSSQAAEKLKEVFETLFTRPPPGTDSLEPVLGITSFEPSGGTIGAIVTLTGPGLEDVDRVEFGGGAVSPADYDDEAGVLSTTVPQGAATGTLAVRMGETEARSVEEFEVES